MGLHCVAMALESQSVFSSSSGCSSSGISKLKISYRKASPRVPIPWYARNGSVKMFSIRKRARCRRHLGSDTGQHQSPANFAIIHCIILICFVVGWKELIQHFLASDGRIAASWPADSVFFDFLLGILRVQMLFDLNKTLKRLFYPFPNFGLHSTHHWKQAFQVRGMRPNRQNAQRNLA